MFNFFPLLIFTFLNFVLTAGEISDTSFSKRLRFDEKIIKNTNALSISEYFKVFTGVYRKTFFFSQIKFFIAILNNTCMILYNFAITPCIL